MCFDAPSALWQHKGTQMNLNTNEQSLLTKVQIKERLNLPSTRGVDELVRRRKIPVVKLGHRTVRFNWPDVQAAIAKLTLKAVG